MSVNESGLKRTVKKDGELQKKLVVVRKKEIVLLTNYREFLRKKIKLKVIYKGLVDTMKV